MAEFDFILKQINERIEKIDSKIQELSVKIIPLEEDRDKLRAAKNGLEGKDNSKLVINNNRTSAKIGSNVRDVILHIIKNSDIYLNAKQIYNEIKKDHEYNEVYVLTSISSLALDNVIEKDRYGKFKMRGVGPVEKDYTEANA